MRFGFGPLTLESPVGWRCVGCSRPADGSCCGKKQVDVFEEGLEQAVTAEWWGFDSVWAGEANFSKVGFNSSSPVVAAGIAQRTEFVRVGVMPTLGLVNAIYLAEEVACIDNIAAGRSMAPSGTIFTTALTVNLSLIAPSSNSAKSPATFLLSLDISTRMFRGS